MEIIKLVHERDSSRKEIRDRSLEIKEGIWWNIKLHKTITVTLWPFHGRCIRFVPKSNSILWRKRIYIASENVQWHIYDSASSHFMRISVHIVLVCFTLWWYLTIIIPAELYGEIWPDRNDTRGATYRESEYTSDLLNANLLRE